MAQAKSKADPVKFSDRLILFRFFLHKFGKDSLRSLAGDLNSTDYEGYDENHNTWFYGFLKLSAKENGISTDILRAYDENICRHLAKINEKRSEKIVLKYFQYISLLFTEFYLDGYFLHTADFICELNEYLDRIRAETHGAVSYAHYTAENMNKLAFMCATGSGKTLLMHINILQFRYYIKLAERRGHGTGINKIILLTPNEGLSAQHLDELTQSSIRSSIFSKNLLGFSAEKDTVFIIDINKLEEKDGIKTVAIDSFEQNNLVLVDEGHRGLTGDVWYDYRSKLSAEGFSFEYSATFKQALRSQKAKDTEKLMAEYGRAIIMDYSYKYFYEDGYGKDYRIYNLKENISTEQSLMYLTGCLMSFYQQLKLYHTYKKEYAPFRIEKPLLVFVGNRVTATTTASELTDVEKILAFIDTFVMNKAETAARIRALLHGDTGLTDAFGNELFYQDFAPLQSILDDPADIYSDMLRTVFNAGNVPDVPRLHIVDLKQAEGEIGLKIGNNGYFGLISVGDTSALIRKCEEDRLITDTEEFRSGSLFRTINAKDSELNVLIGSRKFSEGWNSWRVSTMGLINFGQNEGSQAIQLFGRGVRLKGYNGCLKRSGRTDSTPAVPRYIQALETLTVFGIKAQYMEDFKRFLSLEDAAANETSHEFILPVLSRFSMAADKDLQVIGLPERIKNNYKKLAPRRVLSAPEDDFAAFLAKNKIVIDCCSKVQTIESDFSFQLQATAQERTIPESILPYLSYHRIFEELEAYKNEKQYYSLIIDRKPLREILAFQGFYGLIIPEKYLTVDSYAKLEAVSDYAVMVLKVYMDRFFAFQKGKWESPFLEYQTLAETANFETEYRICYTDISPEDRSAAEIETFIGSVKAGIEQNGCMDCFEQKLHHEIITALDLKKHLYTPLISIRPDVPNIRITPVPLNQGEREFVRLLHAYLENARSEYKDQEMYLLRNKSKAGIGFFEAGNFYPDFILWIKDRDCQRISYIDPKGLRRLSLSDPKLRFYQTIKELQKQLSATYQGGRIILNSFILSVTPYLQLKELFGIGKPEQEQRHIFCLDSPDCISRMLKAIMNDG